jgi:hypothetical protein
MYDVLCFLKLPPLKSILVVGLSYQLPKPFKIVNKFGVVTFIKELTDLETPSRRHLK